MALFGGKNRNMQTEAVSDTRMAPPVNSSRPSFNDLTVGDMSSGVPRIRVGEMFGSVKRQFKWFIPLLILGIIGAWFLTKDFTRTYHADGTILVQLGSEYVYDPIGAEQTTGAGLTLTPDHIVLNEIALMKNSDTITRLTTELEAQFGSRFAPDNFAKRARLSEGSREYNDAVVELRTIADRSFGVSAKPKSSILAVTFKHEEPEIAVAGLNLIIESYLDFRRTIFVEGTSEVITERRAATEEQLQENQRAIVRFLANNGVSDFTSERTGVTERTEELRVTLNTLRADLTENERALATVENQLRDTPEQIDLQVDDRASQRVAQAELELSQLLVKYLPTSEPVRRKQAEVDELNRLQSTFGGNARGGRRVGPNEVFQALLTRRNTLQSTADALREKETIVQQQLDTADEKVRKLQKLSPAYADLLRERDTLDERLKDYTTREQEAVINQQQAQVESENVKVIDQSTYPRKGRNMRMLMFALAVLGWGLTLSLIALMRVFLDPALYLGTQNRARRGSDRVAPAQPIYEKEKVVPAAASYAADTVIPDTAIPEPVTGPEVWEPDPASAASSYYADAGPAEDPYRSQNYQPQVQHYTAGNAAPDLNYNPYQPNGAVPRLPETPPYIGVVPASPES